MISAANTESFHERQLFLLYNPQQKGLAFKLQTSWDGSYKIIKRLNDVVYMVQKANKNEGRTHRATAKCGKKDNESIRNEQA